VGSAFFSSVHLTSPRVVGKLVCTEMGDAAGGSRSRGKEKRTEGPFNQKLADIRAFAAGLSAAAGGDSPVGGCAPAVAASAGRGTALCGCR